MSHRTWVLAVGLPVLSCALAFAGCAKNTSGSVALEPSSASPSTGDGANARDLATSARESRRFSVADYKPVAELKEIYFEFDRSDVRTVDLPTLDRNAAWMLEHATYVILIEGHTDERGTSEYNLALGDRRAKSAMNYLVSKGVPAKRITVLSYGHERPLCREAKEWCFAKNRRAAFLARAE